MSAVLEYRDVSIEFPGPDGPVRAVDRVSLRVGPGEIVGLIGESGSGKSLLALRAAGLTPPPGRLTGGSVQCDGRPGLVMQEASGALNPVLRIGFQLREVSPGGVVDQSLLRTLGFEDPDAVLRAYPHQLSGGQAQRAFIAVALAANPRIVIADEPTTGLDAATQREILALFTTLVRDRDIGLLLISHDLAVVGELADRIAVIHGGRIVEAGPASVVLGAPRHPFTRLLSDPYRDGESATRRPVPAGFNGCGFYRRCPSAESLCATTLPDLAPCADDHLVRCPIAGEDGRKS